MRAGRGLRGIGERAAALGGTTAARDDGGRWTLSVALPAGELGGSIQVLLVDDEPFVRSGLQAILESEPDIVVVGEADDGAAAVSQARRTHPDIVLMDARMPRVYGITATRLLGQFDGGGPAVIVVTTFENDDYEEVLRLVAQGSSNAEIAAELVLGLETVKTHVRNVLAKPGVRDRVQAVISAYESGFVH